MDCFRIKTLRLEELKTNIVEEVKACDREENRISEFKNEMEALLQDKMSHVEELRQIHSDINVVSNILFYIIRLQRTKPFIGNIVRVWIHIM